MQRKKILLSVIVLTSSVVYGQSVNEKFEFALDVYKEAINLLSQSEQMDVFEALDKLDSVQMYLEFSREEFISINKQGYEDYKIAAGYYSVLCNVKLGKVYNFLEDYASAYKVLGYVKNLADGTTNIQLPIKYRYKGTNYEVRAEHLNVMKSDYYYEIYWTCKQLKKYDEEVENIYKYLQLNNISKYDRIEAINELIELKENNLYSFNQDGVVDYLVGYIDVYYQLSTDDKIRLLDRKDQIGINNALGKLEQEIRIGNLSAISYSRIITLVDKIASEENTSETLYDILDLLLSKLNTLPSTNGKLLVAGTTTNYFEFLLNIDKVARRSLVKSTSVIEGFGNTLNFLQMKEAEKATKIAATSNTLLADKSISINDCDYLAKAIVNLEYWKQPELVKKYTPQLPNCREQARKAELKAQRAIQRANSTFNFYAGIYPFGLIAKSENMDFGGVVNIVNNKSVVEFSYLKMQNKLENYFDLWIDGRDYDADDLPKWNGYYSHIQYKRLTNAPYYFGILGGYAQKSFSTFSENVTDNATSAVVSEAFTPYSKQYIFMFNEGCLCLFKGFGFDAFVGMGVTYNTFDLGSDVDRTTHTIDNPVLQYRKDNYFSFIARAGITIGLNIGNGVRKK